MKMIIRVNNKKYIVTAAEAETVMDIVAKSECYSEEWHSKTETTPSYYTYHVWWEGEERERSLNFLSEGTYLACKLLGKPEKAGNL